MTHEDGAEYGGQESQIAQALKAPSLMSGFELAHLFRGASEIEAVHDEEHREQNEHSHEPNGPAILRHPPEGDAFEIAKEKRRITNRGEAAAYVGDDKDEKNHVMPGEAVLVHPEPRTDEQH